MGSDDILWRNVEALKQEAHEAPKPPSRGHQTPPKASVSGKPRGNDVITANASQTETTEATSRPTKTSVPRTTPDRPGKQAGSQAIEQASYHASNQASMIEEIRHVVKDTGAKTTFVRLTQEEKNRLLDLVYTYRRQGVKISENELVRIAIGYMLGDYNERGKASMLEKVLAALNA